MLMLRGLRLSRRALLGVLLAFSVGAASLFGERSYSSAEIYRMDMPAVAHVFALERGSSTVLYSGTGFFVHSSGVLVTAAHVVSDDNGHVYKFIFVKASNGRYYTAEVVRMDLAHDVAVLCIMRTLELRNRESGLLYTRFVVGEEVTDRFRTLDLGRSDDVAPGERLTVLGFPGRFTQTVTEGVLMSGQPQHVALKDGDVTFKDMLALGCMVFPGNSGGPVFNARGEVVGVATIGVSTGKAFSFFQRAEYVWALLESDSDRVVVLKKLPYDKRYGEDADE